MRKLFPPQKNGIPSTLYFPWQHKWMENSSNGCEDLFLEWRLERESVHISTRRLCFEGTRT
jgi:hypothetical protein